MAAGSICSDLHTLTIIVVHPDAPAKLFFPPLGCASAVFDEPFSILAPRRLLRDVVSLGRPTLGVAVVSLSRSEATGVWGQGGDLGGAWPRRCKARRAGGRRGADLEVSEAHEHRELLGPRVRRPEPLVVLGVCSGGLLPGCARGVAQEGLYTSTTAGPMPDQPKSSLQRVIRARISRNFSGFVVGVAKVRG